MSPIIVAIIVSISAIVGYISYKVSTPDNQVEQACEAIIKIETGADIDLSPDESSLPPEAKPDVAPIK